MLITQGTDELGRLSPFLFNALHDYQLPVTSYLTAGGEAIFGKSDLGVRIPFILIGILISLLTFQVAKFFSPNFFFRITSAIITAFSPALIVLSKVPNETIVLTFILLLLFYLLITRKNLIVIILTMVIAILVSKLAWLIIPPFVFFTIFFYSEPIKQKRQLILISSAILITLSIFIFYLTIPQAKRSLLENNFSLFSDVTIKNGIDTLRGQGLESSWPSFLERVLFNKSHYLITGFLHWISHLNPAIYFGQFDSSGKLNFSQIGALSKILIIPATFGVIFLIKKGDKKSRFLFAYFLILTFPSLFIYPNLSLELAVITIPFVSLIMAFGISQIKEKLALAILFIMMFELFVNMINLTPEYKNTNNLRPAWVKDIASDISSSSKEFPTAVSDDIVSDIVPLIQWYGPTIQGEFSSISYPYKFRQYNLADIKIMGSDQNFSTCSTNEHQRLFISKRDLEKAQKAKEVKISKIYRDNLGTDRVFAVLEDICIR